jgi:hypothetical protein
VVAVAAFVAFVAAFVAFALAATAFAFAFVFAAAFAFVAVVTAAAAMFAPRRFVLMGAGAAGDSVAAAGKGQRAAGAHREERHREECRQSLLHERSFCSELRLVVSVTFMAAPGLVVAFLVGAFAGFFAFAAFASFAAFCAFATATAGFPAVALVAMAFAFADAAFFGLFARAFVGNADAFAVHALRRFRFFAGAFIGKAHAFAVHALRRFRFFAGAFIGHTHAFAVDARGFVLVEARAARDAAATAAGQGQRAAGAEQQQGSRKQGREALPCESSFAPRGHAAARRAHRSQLDSIERKRIERGTLVAEHVGDVLEVI